MMMMMPLAESALLFVLGLGYIICYLASKSQGRLKAVGYFIGTFIITLSAIMIVVNIFLTPKICAKMSGMKYHRGMMQPQPPQK